MNTVSNNPDAVQLGQPDGQPDRVDVPLTLQVREIGARLSLDLDDADIQRSQAQPDEVGSPE